MYLWICSPHNTHIHTAHIIFCTNAYKWPKTTVVLEVHSHLSLHFLLQTWFSNSIWCVNVPVTSIRSDAGRDILPQSFVLLDSEAVAHWHRTLWSPEMQLPHIWISVYKCHGDIWSDREYPRHQLLNSTADFQTQRTIEVQSRPPHAGGWYISNTSYSCNSHGWWAP